MSKLPARTGADVHLADAFRKPGCPLCRERSRTEANYLESILAESVNDVDFRRGLDVARGFCGPHCRTVLEADRRSSGSLGAAILLRATLRVRLGEMAATRAAGTWSRARRAEEATRPPRCPACVRILTTDAGVVDGLLRLAEDPAWAEAAATAPFCLEHVLALMNRRSVPAWWEPVEARQLKRLEELCELLDGFAYTSSEDRRHLRTDAQTAAVDEAGQVLGGWRTGTDPATNR